MQLTQDFDHIQQLHQDILDTALSLQNRYDPEQADKFAKLVQEYKELMEKPELDALPYIDPPIHIRESDVRTKNTKLSDNSDKILRINTPRGFCAKSISDHISRSDYKSNSFPFSSKGVYKPRLTQDQVRITRDM